MEVETRSFPENCEVAFPVSTTNLMAKMRTSYISDHTSKPLEPPVRVLTNLSYAESRFRDNNSTNPLRSADGLPAF
jgi:hypothetical protein